MANKKNSVHPKWATVHTRLVYDDPENPKQGEFKFTWDATLFAPRSKTKQFAVISSKMTYGTRESARTCAKEILEQWGYKIIR